MNITRFCKTVLFSLFVMLWTVSGVAQDTIWRNDSTLILAKVEQVGIDEVQFRIYSRSNGLLYSLYTSEVLQIVYANGRIETFPQNPSDSTANVSIASRSAKLNVYNLFGLPSHFSFGHEWAGSNLWTWELYGGVIGGPINQHWTDYMAGGFVTGSVKRRLTPPFKRAGRSVFNPLDGFFLRAEAGLVVSSDRLSYENPDPSGPDFIRHREELVTSFVSIGFTRQFVFGQKFSVEPSLSYGGSYMLYRSDSSGAGFNSNMYGHDPKPGFTMFLHPGITFGYLFP